MEPGDGSSRHGQDTGTRHGDKTRGRFFCLARKVKGDNGRSRVSPPAHPPEHQIQTVPAQRSRTAQTADNRSVNKTTFVKSGGGGGLDIYTYIVRRTWIDILPVGEGDHSPLPPTGCQLSRGSARRLIQRGPPPSGSHSPTGRRYCDAEGKQEFFRSCRKQQVWT